MKLENVLSNIEIMSIIGPKNIEVEGMEYDSRNIKKGDLFVCINGYNVDGHKFIESAKQKGANAFLVDEDVSKDDGLTYIRVKDTNKALNKMSMNFYENPSQKLKLIGVTGTNGKTSIASFLKILLNTKGCGFIGTTGIYDGKKYNKTKNTTPNSMEIQKHLNEMVKNDCKYCVMEVSSHALALDRVKGLDFDIGIFTNLTEDHLDFHKTLENYRKAKEKLFYMTTKGNIINVDDINGKIILENIKNLKSPYLTYGINSDATFKGENVKLYDDKTEFTLVGPNNLRKEVCLNMVGQFTVYNVLAVITACYALDMNINDILNKVSSLKCVSGRFERVENNKNINVFVDYAHTPDALENVLKSINTFANGKIITVFGCGGNREKQKRPIMASISQKYSDLTIITSDNPRNEEPKDIIKDILEGIDKEKEDYTVIEDRKEAIKEALKIAKERDVVLIAGKGHENYQIIKDKVIDFNDKEVAKEILNNTN